MVVRWKWCPKFIVTALDAFMIDYLPSSTWQSGGMRKRLQASMVCLTILRKTCIHVIIMNEITTIFLPCLDTHCLGRAYIVFWILTLSLAILISTTRMKILRCQFNCLYMSKILKLTIVSCKMVLILRFMLSLVNRHTSPMILVSVLKANLWNMSNMI
jgi:hypothetical protein